MYAYNRIYSKNFTNELTLFDKQYTFLTFKNEQNLSDLFIFPIIEILNTDADINTFEDKYKNKIFINNFDVFEINKWLKHATNLDYSFLTGVSNPTNSSNDRVFSIIGSAGDLNFTTDIDKMGFRFKTDLKIGPNGSNFYSTLEKNGYLTYKIDYTGEEDLIVKITFIITSINPNNYSSVFNFWNEFPILNPTSPKKGDVKFTGSIWQYYDGSSFINFNSPYDINGPYLGIKHLHELNYYNDINSTGSSADKNFIDYQECYLFCYKNKKQKTDRENYFLNYKNHDYKNHDKIIDDDLYSYALLRTNPKMSGNIKLIVDSKNNIYLESIDANKELSDDKFKKIKIDSDKSFAYYLYKYFKDVPESILFEVAKKNDENYSIKKNLYEQYEQIYNYGVSQLNSKFYDEEFKIFAPIWLRKKLPEFFIIFKLNGPLNEKTYQDGFNNKDILLDIFKNSKILKTYDLRKGTKIGDFLFNLVNDFRFKEFPLFVNFSKDELTKWNGIIYKEGTIAEKGELLYDFYKFDNPIIKFDEYITSGFERHGLICYNLINLEFLFNDDEAKEFEINRYFGFYFNSIELAEFELLADVLKFTGNTPMLNDVIIKNLNSIQSFIQTNQNGVEIPIDDRSIKNKIPKKEYIDDKLKIFALKDKNNNFYRINDLKYYDLYSQSKTIFLEDGTKVNNFNSLVLYDTKIDLKDLVGITQLKFQLNATLLDEGNSQLELNLFDELNENKIFIDGEYLEIEFINENGEKNIWRYIANSTGLFIGDCWNFPVYNEDLNLYENTFNPNGTPDQVAEALTKCINSFKNSIVIAFNKNNKIYLKSKLSGEIGNKFIFKRILKRYSVFNNLKFYSINPNTSNILNDFTISNTTTNPGIVNFELIEYNINTLNDYKVEVLNYIYNTSINLKLLEVAIYENDGLIDTFIFNLNDLNNNYYDNGEIQLKMKSISAYSPSSSSSNSDPHYNNIYTFIHNNNTIEQKFVGGENNKRRRALVNKNEVLNLEFNVFSNVLFQTHKNSFNKLKEFDIQGQKIYTLNYLEEPIYDAEILKDYNKLETHSVIELKSNYFEFYLSNDKKIIAFNYFRPTVNILSFLNIKDFDFDFHSSDYSYIPNLEVLSYFDKIELKTNEEYELPTFSDFKLDSGIIDFYAFDNSTKTWVYLNEINSSFPTNQTSIPSNNLQFPIFNTYFPIYEYTTNKTESNTIDSSTDQKIILSSSPTDHYYIDNYYYRNFILINKTKNYTKFKIVAKTDNVIVSKYSFGQDLDLANFNGFVGLSDFLSRGDVLKLSELISNNDINRFFFGRLKTEYDRLKENTLKEFALKSRVVPYINKWVSYGTDCRDNKYRLNTSLAFNLNNFTPDYDIKEQNAYLNTHEFYYLDTFPFGIKDDEYKYTKSYFYKNISDFVLNDKSYYDLFKSNENDYFSKYFNIGHPSELDSNDESVNKRLEERFTYFKFIEGINTCQTIFRGVKINIKELNKTTKEIIKDSKKYDNYKFSAILRILPESFNKIDETEIEIISNDIYKTCLMIITIYLNDYKINSKEYGYLFLYSTKSKLKNNNTFSILDEYFDTSVALNSSNQSILSNSDSSKIKGYRSYNDIINNKIIISSGNKIDYSDIKIDGIFDLSTFYNYLGDAYIKTFNNFNLDIFKILTDDFKKQNIYKYYLEHNINNIIDDKYSIIVQSFNYLNNVIDQFYSETNKLITNKNELVIKNYYVKNTFGTDLYNFAYPTYTSPFFNFSTGFDVSNTNTFYIYAGKDYLKQKLEEISFASIKNLIENNSNNSNSNNSNSNNSNSNKVKYYTINENGLEDGNFKLEFIEPQQLIKEDRLLVVDDIDKPNQFKNKELIGYNLERKNNLEKLYRHSGFYEPKSYKVFEYLLRENNDFTNYYNLDFLKTNTTLNIDFERFGLIKNMYFYKVSEDEILILNNNDKYKPIYPILNEINIDKSDFFIFNSNWDSKYFKKYQNSNSNFTLIDGTFEMKNKKSFFGSKLMNVPKTILFEKFNNNNEISYDLIKSISNTGVNFNDNENLNIKDNKDKLIITIDLEPILIRKLIEDGADYEFKKLKNNELTRFKDLNDDQLIEEVKKYLNLNILDLYDIQIINFYKKENAKENVDPIFRTDLNDLEKLFNGYTIDKNIILNKLSKFKFTLTKTLDSKKYSVYSLSVKIGRI